MMSTVAIDAYATNKATLFEMAAKLPGSKVLEGRWGVERHAIAIPKGREPAMAFIRQFTNEMKSEGAVGAAIARAGLRGAMISAAE
jgi:polar amino acid transport system substrate-binding protein